MNTPPIISIIIPVYNVAQYLPQCLDSVVNQTYQHLEIICINDGSTDSSATILHQYASLDSRITIIDQENHGLSFTRNVGLSVASGNYILFLDSDDWIDRDTCSQAIDAIIHTGADFVFWSYVREFSNFSKERYLLYADGTIFTKEEVINVLQRRQCGLIGSELSHPEEADSLSTAWGKLYSKASIAKAGATFIDTKIIGTEDALFNLYVLGSCNKAVYLRKCMNHYRKENISSLTKRYRPMLTEQWNILFQYMNVYIEKEKLPLSFTEALNNRIAMSILGLGLNVLCSSRPPMEQISMLRDLLRDPQYRQAVSKLTLRYFPIHWKVFYICAKLGFAPGIYGLLRAIQYFISRGTV